MCVPVCMHTTVYVGAWEAGGVSCSLELELQLVVNYPLWMVGAEL